MNIAEQHSNMLKLQVSDLYIMIHIEIVPIIITPVCIAHWKVQNYH